jgi:hypothetical protein
MEKMVSGIRDNCRRSWQARISIEAINDELVRRPPSRCSSRGDFTACWARGQPVGDWFRHSAAVNSASFSPDGKRVVTAFPCEVAMQYPAANTIHLVPGNLNTHRRKSVIDVFGEQVGGEIWERFTIHYTPTHGSWLNQAEIEISLFTRQCLRQEENPGSKTLRRETRLWTRGINRDRKKINWRFDRRAARLKFGYKKLNKSFKRSKT